MAAAKVAKKEKAGRVAVMITATMTVHPTTTIMKTGPKMITIIRTAGRVRALKLVVAMREVRLGLVRTPVKVARATQAIGPSGLAKVFRKWSLAA